MFRKEVVSAIAIAMTMIVASGIEVAAQDNSVMRSILRRAKNWRYGNVSLFQIQGQQFGDVSELLNPTPIAPQEVNDLKAKNPGWDDAIRAKIEEKGCAADMTIFDEIDVADLPISARKKKEVLAAAQYYIKVMDNDCKKFKNAFIVTTRFSMGEDFSVIALITSKDKSNRVMKDLRGVQDADIMLYNDFLQKTPAPAGSPAKTLYEYLKNAVLQGACENVTTDLQGIGEDQFVESVPGRTLPIAQNDVARFVRISEGNPLDYLKQNELIVSAPDYIAFRHYPEPFEDATGGRDTVYNNQLPAWGVELRYGLEEINYPSVWSNRLTLNAVWGGNRLGVILPVKNPLLGQGVGLDSRMTFTNGGGIYGSFDVPISVVKKSGVFNLNGSYVFGDGEPMTAFGPVAAFAPESQIINNMDRLVRFHFQAHYSFALKVDDDYQFRFKLGGTVVTQENWQMRTVTKRDNKKVDSVMKTANETIGGISGKIEFMAQNLQTPWGASISFFDGTLLNDVWLQIPMSSDMAIRLDGKLFYAALREPATTSVNGTTFQFTYEDKTVFVPSIRFIYNF